ncbi:GGDEF domain-containing protein [Dongia soli]|uniref:diguanylate cyclase n=1 Tax=Dongia soli TaxID=600628 RepID=A0ABU5EE22_9PROT|nr:sensor domain-containing diguanylate cyclase [Dongia soli]MDY0884605.1 sensor domain-containing diguanylate cyclase [Dongia soli]
MPVDHGTAVPDSSRIEHQRLHALQSFEILDTPAEPQFDRIVKIAANLLDMPISLISLIDAKRQWIKAREGLDVAETPRSLAFCSHAIQDNDVMVVEDAATDRRFADNPLVTGAPYIRFYAGAPLRSREGHRLGTLCVIDRKPRSISDEHRAMLEDLAAIVVDELELHRANIDLQRLVGLDSLTGAGNRRQFLARAEREIARARRYGQAVSVMMADIDHFKKINDTYGHESGDRALVETVRQLKRAARPETLLGRIGGEEFALLLPHADLTSAMAAAERLRDSVERIELAAEGRTFGLTISIGVCQITEGMSLEAALHQADQALYQAKRHGRNRVEASNSH